ncbi:MAG TPA: DUF2267 domain-containing protein [Caulobacteraceae bacterium]|nr:DUF2267 domain-containing protein [Caulobacteraceae bacterium]
MSTTGLPVFDTTVNETNVWLKALEDELLCDRHKAYQIMRAVLHALRDRLAPGGAMRLAAQLPLLMRGIYVEGWRPDETPIRTHTAQDFVARVAEALPPRFDVDPEVATRAAMLVLWRQMDGGAMEKAREEVPEDIRTLWPEPFLIA